MDTDVEGSWSLSKNCLLEDADKVCGWIKLRTSITAVG